MPRFDAARIRRYYDRNTAAFVAFGQGGDVGAIHRAVWGPGIVDRRQAFRYVEDRIAAVIDSLPQSQSGRHIVDLGCGIGASLCYLAGRLPIRGTGVTLSPTQAALARRRIEHAGLSDRVVCMEGDYANLPDDVAHADLAFAIESLVHSPDPERFFAQCARLILPGGALVICDDVRATATDAPAVERFCRGWHINSLMTTDELRKLATRAGFAAESTVDLTPYLELGRPRDRVLSALMTPMSWLPWQSTRLDPLIGGTALQTCLANGWIQYTLNVFRKA